MKFQRDIFTHRQNNVRTRQVLLVTTGTIINVLLSFAAYQFGLPFFLDSLGTILVSAVSGMLLLGILTAVITSLVCSLFNHLALYLAFSNALLAIFTVWFIQKYTFKKFRRNLVYVLIASVYSAIVISLVHFAIYKQT